MSLSYSGIVGYGKYNLPSVESWGTDNNILKDPPKSIMTRRKDKVGTNSMITQDIEMSRDRIAESILAYPRGVNPMVGVSYNGQGNAGIHSGQALLTRGQQAKLPYRVAMDGAFRPPVLAPVDLLPLSRMPRLVTTVHCSINNPDFRKKLSCSAEKNTYRPVILNTSCENKKIINVKRPTQVIDRRHTNIARALKGELVTNSSQNIQRPIPLIDRRHTNIMRALKGKLSTNSSQNIQRPVQLIDRKHTNLARTLKGELVTNLSQNIQKPVEVVDRRHMHVRKNARATNINANQSDIARGERLVSNPKFHMKNVLNAEALHLNRAQRRDNATIGDTNVTKNIGRTLLHDMTVPRTSFRKETNLAESAGSSCAIGQHLKVINLDATKTGHAKQAEAPNIITSCKDKSFTTCIEPVNIIRRHNPYQERPEYTRANGMGGVLVPDSGVYNSRE